MNFSKVTSVNYSYRAMSAPRFVLAEKPVVAADTLSSPDEVLGRSMVTFKGIKQLSEKDLNFLGKIISVSNVKPEKISILKDTVKKFLNKYKLKNLTEMKTKFDEDDYIFATVELETKIKENCGLSEKDIDKFSFKLIDYVDYVPKHGYDFIY